MYTMVSVVVVHGVWAFGMMVMTFKGHLAVYSSLLSFLPSTRGFVLHSTVIQIFKVVLESSLNPGA